MPHMSGGGQINAFGLMTITLGIALCCALVFHLLAPQWAPFAWLHANEPSAWRFGLQVILLMVNVPLALAAWKSSRRTSKKLYPWERAIVIIWVIMGVFHVIEARLALQREETWRPQILIMMFWAVVFLHIAWGRKPEAASNSSTLNNAGNSPAPESG